MKINITTYVITILIVVFMIPVANAQSLQWAKSMGGNESDASNGIAIDAAGNVYTIGDFRDTVDFNPGLDTFNLVTNGVNDIFLSKFDANGNFIWAKQFGGVAIDHGYSIAVDGLANVYITGTFRDTVDFDPSANVHTLISNGLDDIYICKLDSSGNLIYARSIGGPLTDKGLAIATNNGNVFVTGSFNDTVDFDPGANTYNLITSGSATGNLFVLELNASGDFVWAGGIELGQSEGFSITTDNNGNTYVTGDYSGTVDFDFSGAVSSLTSAGNSDAFILKSDPSGNFLWAKSVGGISQEIGYSVAVDQIGNVYSTGRFSNSVDFDPGAGSHLITATANVEGYILKLDSTGEFVWAKNFSGPNGASSANYGKSIAVDKNYNFYATGQFSGSITFNNTGNAITKTSAGVSDAFVFKADSAGTYLWVNTIGGTNLDAGTSVTTDTTGNVYCTGNFETTAFLDSTGNSIMSNGLTDIYVIKYSDMSVTIGEVSNNSTFSIYPNPTNGFVTLDFGNIITECSVIITNALGQELDRKNYNNSTSLELSIPDEKGLYFITVLSNDHSFNYKIIKD